MPGKPFTPVLAMTMTELGVASFLCRGKRAIARTEAGLVRRNRPESLLAGLLRITQFV